MRQLTNQSGEFTYAKSYDPYGVVTQVSGEGQTNYGFTGETADANGLIYLRARYFNPVDARFVSRDTWAGNVNRLLSMNRWMYVEGNPINRIDPIGKFPISMIDKNIPIGNFAYENATDISWTRRSRWGFLAMLLEAQDFDYTRTGSLDLTHWTPKISYSSTERIWSINCEKIMVGSRLLFDYYQTEVRKQRTPGIYWRDTSARYYDLFRPLESPRTYVDGGNMIDYPHFRSISLGVGPAELNLLVDINGQFHLAVSGGAGGTLGIGYTEGYLCNWAACTDNIDMPSPADISKAIDGFCGEGSFQLVGGIAVSLCPSSIDPLELTGVSAYYLGLEVGYGAGAIGTFSLPYRNPSLGWTKAVQDQINGWDLSAAYYQTLSH